MSEKDYLMVNLETNIVENAIIWNGDTNTWTPPENYLMLVQNEAPAKVWEYSFDDNQMHLVEKIGEGRIGFSWDGEFLITPEPNPLEANK